MNAKHYLGLLFFLFIGITTAQQNGPQISFDKTTIDYGIVENGSEGTRSFIFTNTGTSDLLIEHVQSSCGCTVPKKPEGPISPGENGEIVVHYDTKRTGPFRKTITVTTNIEGNSIVALKLRGTVLPAQ